MPKKHGYTKRGFVPRIYTVWLNMIRRCTRPNHKAFKDYGGRGITVCDRWMEFKNFVEDVGEPLPGMSIERKDNSLGYCPENVRWATRKDQSRNRRSNRVFTINGMTACITDLCIHLKIPYSRVRTRLDRGWPPESAFLEPWCQGSKKFKQ
jgi:hypothetical protein